MRLARQLALEEKELRSALAAKIFAHMRYVYEGVGRSSAHMGHIIIMFDGPNDMNWDLLSGPLPGMVSSSQYSRAYKRLEEVCM